MATHSQYTSCSYQAQRYIFSVWLLLGCAVVWLCTGSLNAQSDLSLKTAARNEFTLQASALNQAGFSVFSDKKTKIKFFEPQTFLTFDFSIVPIEMCSLGMPKCAYSKIVPAAPIFVSQRAPPVVV